MKNQKMMMSVLVGIFLLTSFSSFARGPVSPGKDEPPVKVVETDPMTTIAPGVIENARPICTREPSCSHPWMRLIATSCEERYNRDPLQVANNCYTCALTDEARRFPSCPAGWHTDNALPVPIIPADDYNPTNFFTCSTDCSEECEQRRQTEWREWYRTNNWQDPMSGYDRERANNNARYSACLSACPRNIDNVGKDPCPVGFRLETVVGNPSYRQDIVRHYYLCRSSGDVPSLSNGCGRCGDTWFGRPANGQYYLDGTLICGNFQRTERAR